MESAYDESIIGVYFYKVAVASVILIMDVVLKYHPLV